MTQEIDKLPPREAKKTNDSTFDRIYKFYFGKVRIELTPAEIRIRDRWDMCFKLLCNMHTERKVVQLLQKKFDITISVAYNDVRNTKALFGDSKNVDREFKRKQSEEWTLWGIKQAKKDNNLEALDKLVGRFNKINGLDVESDNEYADMVKKLTPTALVFVLDTKQLQKEADSLMDKIPSVDADFEDVSDEAKG
jgi:hypothetical protein